MMPDRTFVSYQVKGRLKSGQRIVWYLLSPSGCLDRVDVPFWNFLREKGLFEGEWRFRQQYSSLADLYSAEEQTGQAGQWKTMTREGLLLTSAAERHAVLCSLPSALSANREASSTDSAADFSSFSVNSPIFPNEQERRLASTFAGRHLLLQEVSKACGTRADNGLLNTLQRLYLQGYFDWDSPIAAPSGPHRHTGVRFHYCQRCGYGRKQVSDHASGPMDSWWTRLRSSWSIWGSWSRLGTGERLVHTACARCGRAQCLYCPQCLQMGRVKACEPYLKWRAIPCGQQERERGETKVRFRWQGTLSPAQQEASDRLVHFVHGREGRLSPIVRFLLWAVCGAGKTEIWFATIYHALQRRQKVLITSPRRDVILELEPRLKEAFPNTAISVLHGESEQRYASADLFLATTHQTLRFRHYFDLVIVDEEDAYPYHHDPLLPYAVQEAQRPDGKRIYVTATPTQEMKDSARRGEMDYVLIPERYHGHPLAVPHLQPLGRWRQAIRKQHILTPLLHYITHLLQEKRSGYLFVPHVSVLQEVYTYLRESILPYLQSSFPGRTDDFVLETVHAQDPERTQKVKRFREQRIQLLITTTILERGVTIPFSDVAVLGSDDRVFDSAALIQISGRVGRKTEDPLGQVWFFPEQRTRTQVQAIRQIKAWNRMKNKTMR